ncbi:transposase [Marinomonas sp. TI.3.20]|uniref:transposase n=1 Tax=Marinomonas sp. TI.3.20 TaxID=3121296 RepID=UPI00311EA43D
MELILIGITIPAAVNFSILPCLTEPPASFGDRKERYCWHTLLINLVFVVKRRSAALTYDEQAYLKTSILEASRNFGADLVCFESDATYISFRLSCGPTTPGAANLVRSLKSMTSRHLKREFADAGDFAWDRFYVATSQGTLDRADVVKILDEYFVPDRRRKAPPNPNF